MSVDLFIPEWQKVKRFPQFVDLGQPIVSDRAEGPYFFSNGKKYIDFLMGWGSIILGHANPVVNEVITANITNGLIFSNHSQIEFEVGELFCKFYPFRTRIGFFLNGTDSVAAAVRIARAATSRELVYYSGYHGWHDWSQPIANGVPLYQKGISERFYKVDDEMIDSVEKNANRLACIVLEIPVRSEDAKGYIHKIKNLASEHGVLLIFDEIKSGLRMGFTPGYTLYDAEPDMIIYGKAFSGGLPLSILLIKDELSKYTQNTMLCATYWGWPIALYVTKRLITLFQEEQLLDDLHQISSYFCKGLNDIFAERNLNIHLDQWSTMPCLITNEKNEIVDKFYEESYKQGLFFRQPRKNWFISLSHDKSVIDTALEKFRSIVRKI